MTRLFYVYSINPRPDDEDEYTDDYLIATLLEFEQMRETIVESDFIPAYDFSLVFAERWLRGILEKGFITMAQFKKHSRMTLDEFLIQVDSNAMRRVWQEQNAIYETMRSSLGKTQVVEAGHGQSMSITPQDNSGASTWNKSE